MNEFPGPNSVIVMDNASIHKSWELRDMIERRYEARYRAEICYIYHDAGARNSCICRHSISEHHGYLFDRKK